jgi:Protein of unknown function (DUF1552)
MGSFKLKRRTILRGLGGAVLSLPFMEAMGPGARAQETPKRLCIVYGGMSRAADGSPNMDVPDNPGQNYDLKRAMMALGSGPLPSNPGPGGNGYDVQDHVSIVSGLKIPWDTGSGIPLGGKSPEFHYNSIGPQISGMRAGPGRTEPPNGPSADQIVASQIAGNTPFPSLSYRVQAASYVGSNSTGGNAGRVSWSDDGSGGVDAIDPVFSPELAYATLFNNFVPPDPELAAAAELRNRRHSSVIDLVRRRTEELVPKLSYDDKVRMEKHLDEIRALEIRLGSVPPVGGSCQLPPDPGADPPVEGSAIEYEGQGGNGAGYSNEDLRAELMFDMVTMAFACDVTRVAAVRMTWTQCHMQVSDLLGYNNDLHELGHSGNDDGVADAVGWHVKHVARFIAGLRDSQEQDGSSLLDHTAVLFLLEGGLGYDPEGDRPESPHSTENMIALVGGHAGGLNPNGGKHIPTNEMHPAQATISVMNAVGVAEQDETLGEISGKIDELFT